MPRLKPHGPRGVIMLALAVLAFGRTVAYLQPASPTFTPKILLDLSPVVPVFVWGILWGATGVYLTISAFRQRHALALAAVASMSLLWAFVYIYAAYTRTLDAGAVASIGAWITATVYIAIATIVICVSKMINKVERATHE